MILKELAHLAQQTLEDRASCPVKRSHVHELLAAACGYRSWAAFLSESVLADAGVGSALPGALPELIGRAVQPGYSQPAATAVAATVHDFIAEHQLSAVSWNDLRAALIPAAKVDDHDEFEDEYDEDDEGWADEPATPASSSSGPKRQELISSTMLVSSLEQAAGPANPQAHFLLAALYRCGRPNAYLYEESPVGVRRDKVALSSGCKSRPANAPAGSNRSRHGADEMSEAFG